LTNGKPDLLITAEWQPIYIFLNDGKKLKRFSSPVLDKEKGLVAIGYDNRRMAMAKPISLPATGV
jgi:hypothetical protein